MDCQTQQLPPHVLIFPLQAQGHVNSMLKLAELLCIAGLHVTFLVSDRTYLRLVRHTNIQSHFARYAGFCLESISDGIPSDSPNSGADLLTQIFISLGTTIKPLFRELLLSNRLSSETRRPVTCIIADGVMSFALDFGEELGIPVIYFRTVSACSFWSYFCLPKLIEAGELPFSGNDLDVPIKNVSGMEGFLRRRDLPGICRVGDLSNPDFQVFMTETLRTPRAHGLILNTFEELEGPILSQIRTRVPNIYTIGPLHAQLKARLEAGTTSSNSLWEEDRSCLTWLDSQPLKSVIYISFGSFTVMSRSNLLEFWHGLINSGKRFLWVIRPDLVAGGDGNSKGEIPRELWESSRERGFMVEWAPQEEVLAHPSVAGFLTHSGWNSTLECIVAGLPMICWPYFADQQINSRFVGEVWKLGLDMKDNHDRLTVQKMIKDLMEVKAADFQKSAHRLAKLAASAINDGGSSYRNLDRLIEDIRFMSSPPST